MPIRRILLDGTLEDVGGGGSETITTDDLRIIPGLAVDGINDDGPAIQAALDAVEDGERGAHLLIHGDAGSVCYINSTITISASGVILEADVPLSFGPNARVRPWGVIEEQPEDFNAKPALTQDAPSGTYVLHLDQIPDPWVAGIYIGLRGKRNPDGSVPNEEIFHSFVASIDRSDPSDLTMTLVDPLPKTFLAVNDTTWSNKESQVTLVMQSAMTGTPTLGDTTITVETAGIFGVGDILRILDDTNTLDGGGTVQTGNFAHKEVNRVAEIVNSTTIKLSHPLKHTYLPASNAHVERLEALRDVELRNWQVGFDAQGADGTHAFEVRYAHNVVLTNMRIVGGGDAGVSWDGHAVRFTDSLDCHIVGGYIADPSNVDAGRGYGVSFYGATNCTARGVHVSGTRHSFLWFNGASGCEAHECVSTDARISDYDWHGADCGGNKTVGCTAQGGARNTPDSSERTAWKWGNPSHRPGDNQNTAIGCLVIDYDGAAVEGIPDCVDNLWSGRAVRVTTGVKLTWLPDDNTVPLSGFTIRDSEFVDVPIPFEVDGGTNAVVSGLVLDNVTFTRCGPLVFTNAPGTVLRRVAVADPAMGSAYAVTAEGCPALRVVGCDFTGVPKGIYLEGCSDARVSDNTWYDMGAATVLEDAGGNTGFYFARNWTHPQTAARINSGAGPSSGATVAL